MKRFACILALVLALGPTPVGIRREGSIAVPRPAWRSAGPGLERTTVEVAASGEGWRTLIVAVRIDPSRYRFRLRARLNDTGAGWTVDRAPLDAVLAFNVGQFAGYTPWGWVVMDGQEIRPPGHGPLSTAVAWDRSGRVHWLAPQEIAAHRSRGPIVEAFQSYPTLIDGNGEVPRPITEPGLGVRVAHRDGRLAIGADGRGRLLVAVTRFNGFGQASPALPLGLTLTEMATVMRALGCERAVALDGGISAQLMLRTAGRTDVWRGWRRVPLGLIAQPKEGTS